MYKKVIKEALDKCVVIDCVFLYRNQIHVYVHMSHVQYVGLSNNYTVMLWNMSICSDSQLNWSK